VYFQSSALPTELPDGLGRGRLVVATETRQIGRYYLEAIAKGGFLIGPLGPTTEIAVNKYKGFHNCNLSPPGQLVKL